MKHLKLFEEFANLDNMKIFKDFRDTNLIKKLIKIYNIIKNVFDGDNYEEICEIIKNEYNKQLDPKYLKFLTLSIYKNNKNECITESKKKWFVLLIPVAIAISAILFFNSNGKKVYENGKEYYKKDIEKKGFKNVKYVEYEFFEPIMQSTPFASSSQTAGVGIFEGVKDNIKYRIYVKALSATDAIITKIEIIK